MNKIIAVLAGDGIGPEVIAEAKKVLHAVAQKCGHVFTFKEALIGGAAFDVHTEHFPAETEEICRGADAILFGSVGGPISESQLPKWKGCESNSILALRKTFKFNANLRPARVFPQLKAICPLKEEILAGGVDLLIIRELNGDIYFGEHKTFTRDDERVATDVAEYTESQITAIAHVAFQAARKRRKKITSVDKANVLDTSKLWRTIVSEIAKVNPDIEVEHMLVDNCAMQIIKNPAQFDVLLTGNLFGDILSDAASVLPGSLGLTPSASFNEDGFALYEPSGGSAPDIAGNGIANPIAQILSAAMMLRHSFGLIEEADLVENAVDLVLTQGVRTKDIANAGEKCVSTRECGDAIVNVILSTI